jgi:hypothetical protein
MVSLTRRGAVGRSLARAAVHVSWRASWVEAAHYYEAWDRMGNWTTRTVKVENWADVPLAEPEQ